MDITEVSAQRFELGIERFLAGQSITFGNVVFCKDPAGLLVVSSFSEHVHLESSSPGEALQKIRSSKQVLCSLAERSEAFASVANSLPRKYEFCFNDGKTSVLLASENNDKFNWCN